LAYWMVTVQEDMLEEIVRRSALPAEERRATELIRPGDYVIVYVAKYYARRFGGSFVLVGKVASDWREKSEVVYPPERAINKPVYLYEAKVDYLAAGNCRMKDIMDSLAFVEDRLRLFKYVRGIPANLGRPVPEGDARVIEECIKQNGLDLSALVRPSSSGTLGGL